MADLIYDSELEGLKKVYKEHNRRTSRLLFGMYIAAAVMWIVAIATVVRLFTGACK